MKALSEFIPSHSFSLFLSLKMEEVKKVVEKDFDQISSIAKEEVRPSRPHTSASFVTFMGLMGPL